MCAGGPPKPVQPISPHSRTTVASEGRSSTGRSLTYWRWGRCRRASTRRSACSSARCSSSRSARKSASKRSASARSFACACLPSGVMRTGVTPAVVRVAASFDEPLFLELVEQSDELSPVVPERVRDLALRLRRALGEDDEDGVVVRPEPGLLVRLHRLLLGPEPEPLEKERRRPHELLGEVERLRRIG